MYSMNGLFHRFPQIKQFWTKSRKWVTVVQEDDVVTYYYQGQEAGWNVLGPSETMEQHVLKLQKSEWDVKESNFEEDFNEALAFRDTGQYSKALTILNELNEKGPPSASVKGILGDIYWITGDLYSAASSFKEATEISPKSELASLGLFHVLLGLEKEEEAKKEMDRFLQIAESKEYQELVKQMS